MCPVRRAWKGASAHGCGSGAAGGTLTKLLWHRCRPDVSRHLQRIDIRSRQGPQPRCGELGQLLNERAALAVGGGACAVRGGQRNGVLSPAQHLRMGVEGACGTAVTLLGGAQVFEVSGQS